MNPKILYQKSRRGYTLMIFVLFLMAFLALAALVIDVGFVRLSSRQMQTMTDAAALELQREVDGNLQQPFSMGEAGPTLEFEQPGTVLVDDFEAHPKLGASSAGKWTPSLQPLPVDEQDRKLSDDIVVGTYSYQNVGPDGIAGTSDDNDHGEHTDYQRDDFVSDADAGDVLVRLRRTGENESNGLGPGGSAGPSVPFFFGRGLLMGAGNPEVWSRIQRGVFVRKTSIAQRSPAQTAGPYIEVPDAAGNSVNLIGLINVEVRSVIWQANDSIDAADYLTLNAANPAEIEFRSIGEPSVGEPANDDHGTPVVPTTPKDFPENSGYVSIIAPLRSGGPDRVIGFGLVRVEGDSLVKLPPQLGYQNTSALPRRASLMGLTEAESDELFRQNESLFQNHHGVSAPALVRSED